MSGVWQIQIPDKLVPVFQGEADVRGAEGGRGSGKTRTFALMSAVRCLMFAEAGISGVWLCGRQYMNSLADSSFEEIRTAIRENPILAPSFDLGETYIRTRDGRVSYVFSGLDKSIESIKSKARILGCWVDEADPVTEDAWRVLIPTLREEGEGWVAELWVTWNPRRKGSATDKRFKNSTNPRHKIVTVNWRDNPWFPAKLERDRQDDMRERPDDYDHVWEGGYLSVVTGAYFTSQLRAAKEQGRIGMQARDDLLPVNLFADIGGTGARADAFVFWASQFIGQEIRHLNYYERQGQPIGAHLQWMAEQGYTPGRTTIWLPHDGDTQDKVYDVSYKTAFEKAGYTVEVVENQGKGAAKARIEAARRVFPRCTFDTEKTQAGRDALAWYHEKRDPERNIGLGPEHDWASHGSDAFGLQAIVAETRTAGIRSMPPINYRRKRT